MTLCFAHARPRYAHAVPPFRRLKGHCAAPVPRAATQVCKTRWQQQAGSLTIGEGGVGVSELIKEGVGKGPNGCHSGHWTVVQQLGHLQVVGPLDVPHTAPVGKDEFGQDSI